MTARYETGWQAADAANKQLQDSSEGGLFVRLPNSGDSTTGVFLGEPLVRFTHWTGTRSDNCAGDGCVHCAAHLRVKTSYVINWYDTTARVVRVIELNSRTYPLVIQYRDNPQFSIGSWSYQIQRSGTDTSTTYGVIPSQPLSDEQQRYLAGVERHDLADVCGMHDPAPAPQQQQPANQTTTAPAPVSAVYNDTDIPF